MKRRYIVEARWIGQDDADADLRRAGWFIVGDKDAPVYRREWSSIKKAVYTHIGDATERIRKEWFHSDARWQFRLRRIEESVVLSPQAVENLIEKEGSC